MSVELRKFTEALNQVDKGQIDMSVLDWAQAVGVMHNCGHGEIWELPHNEDGWVDAPAIAKLVEEYVATSEGAKE